MIKSEVLNAAAEATVHVRGHEKYADDIKPKVKTEKLRVKPHKFHWTLIKVDKHEGTASRLFISGPSSTILVSEE